MAARVSRRPSKKGLTESTLALLTSIKAVTSIQRGSSLSERQSHCRFVNGFVVATNDVIIFGSPVVGLAMTCCPHSKTLIAALERCEGEITFSLDGHVLTVKSGRVRVPVPCLDPDALADLSPDSYQGAAGPRLAAALGAIAVIVNDKSDRLICQPVYMSSGIAEGSHDGHYAMQIWHGVEPLPSLALPRETATAVSKHAIELTGLGVDNGSATFWFADNSFIKTRLIDVKAPDFNRVLECKSSNVEHVKADATLFHAVKTVLPFSKTQAGLPSDKVTFQDGQVWAGEAHEGNASFEYPECPLSDCAFNGSYLMTLETVAVELLHDAYEKKLFFRGDNVRGCLMSMSHHGIQKEENV